MRRQEGTLEFEDGTSIGKENDLLLELSGSELQVYVVEKNERIGLNYGFWGCK